MNTMNTQTTENAVVIADAVNVPENVKKTRRNTLEELAQALAQTGKAANGKPLTVWSNDAREMVVYIDGVKRVDCWKRANAVRCYLKGGDAERLTAKTWAALEKQTGDVFRRETIGYGAYPVSVYLSIDAVLTLVNTLAEMTPPARKKTAAEKPAAKPAAKSAKTAEKPAKKPAADKKPTPAEKPAKPAKKSA